jgi:hypothetical protein
MVLSKTESMMKADFQFQAEAGGTIGTVQVQKSDDARLQKLGVSQQLKVSIKSSRQARW